MSQTWICRPMSTRMWPTPRLPFPCLSLGVSAALTLPANLSTTKIVSLEWFAFYICPCKLFLHRFHHIGQCVVFVCRQHCLNRISVRRLDILWWPIELKVFLSKHNQSAWNIPLVPVIYRTTSLMRAQNGTNWRASAQSTSHQLYSVFGILNFFYFSVQMNESRCYRRMWIEVSISFDVSLQKSVLKIISVARNRWRHNFIRNRRLDSASWFINMCNVNIHFDRIFNYFLSFTTSATQWQYHRKMNNVSPR